MTKKITTYKQFESVDSIEEWDAECLEYTDNRYDFLPLQRAYEHYINWCKRKEYISDTRRAFYQHFWDMGYESAKRRVWPHMKTRKGLEYIKIKGLEIKSAMSVSPEQIDTWIKNHLVATFDKEDVVPKTYVYEEFCNYCEERDVAPTSQSMLTRYLKEQWNIPERVARVDGKTERCWAAVKYSEEPLSQGGVEEVQLDKEAEDYVP